MDRQVILSFGGGVDSTTLIVINQQRDRAAHWLGITRDELDAAFPQPDHIVFSDTGAEHQWTYDNIDRLRDEGVPITTVKRDSESITDWCMRLGIVPLMPGGSHICSLKFKGEVMARWAKDQGITRPTWLIGIEADEGARVKRFQKPRDDTAQYLYPLVDLGLTRDRCEQLLQHLRWFDTKKSSCTFCPFKTEAELLDMYRTDPAAWRQCERIESRFQQMSRTKHQAWIDAGKPLNRGGRAPRGMWRKDSWAEGARLFAKRIDGRQLSMSEWAERFDKRIDTTTV